MDHPAGQSAAVSSSSAAAQPGPPGSAADAPAASSAPMTTPAAPAAQTSAPCQVHRRHVPRSHVNEIHHVWPKGDGGPDIPANKVVTCATGHNSIHALIDMYRKLGGEPPWPDRQRFSPQERELADLGWLRIQRQAM